MRCPLPESRSCSARSSSPSSEVHLDQQVGDVLIGLEGRTVLDTVLVLPIAVLDAGVQLLGFPAHRLAQIVFYLRVEVQVGVFAVAVVIHHPVDVAIDQDVGAAGRQGDGPHRGDLPGAAYIARRVGVAVVGVQLQVVEAGYRQVEARAEQVVLDVTTAALVGAGQQDVGDGAELDFATTDLAEGQTRSDLAVPGAVVAGGILRAVVVDAVHEQEQVAEAPAADVLEGDGLLNGRVDFEVLAVQVGETVVLPEQGGSGGQARGQREAGGYGALDQCAHGAIRMQGWRSAPY